MGYRGPPPPIWFEEGFRIGIIYLLLLIAFLIVFSVIFIELGVFIGIISLTTLVLGFIYGIGSTIRSSNRRAKDAE